jgi:EAL domain-containing protein (putative c-di-GMP-specific phosphodiesterase class I)
VAVQQERSARETLDRLRATGVLIAIDDFGTGYSMLASLRRFPGDKLKIDKTFVQEIVDSQDRAPLVAAIVAMGHGLGLEVVAEGVETEEQLAVLRRLNCDGAQGYLLGRPAGVAGDRGPGARRARGADRLTPGRPVHLSGR